MEWYWCRFCNIFFFHPMFFLQNIAKVFQKKDRLTKFRKTLKTPFWSNRVYILNSFWNEGRPSEKHDKKKCVFSKHDFFFSVFTRFFLKTRKKLFVFFLGFDQNWLFLVNTAYLMPIFFAIFGISKNTRKRGLFWGQKKDLF